MCRHVFGFQNREDVLQEFQVMFHVLGTGRCCFLGLWRGPRSFLPYCHHFGEHEAVASSWVVVYSVCFTTIQVKQKWHESLSVIRHYMDDYLSSMVSMEML